MAPLFERKNRPAQSHSRGTRTAATPLRAAACLSLALSACSLFQSGAERNLGQEEARHRAALTTLVVHNRTPHALEIVYRVTAPPTQEVVLGKVAAATRARVAPIPAGEPILLFARKADGAEFGLAPRSYPMDEEWVWDIAANASFFKR